MLQVKDTLISLDLFEQAFCCDLSVCKGACCIEGDAGAPLETDEVMALENALPFVWDDLSPEAKQLIDNQGVAYTDSTGEIVTSIVNGKDCVFTCYSEDGICQCAIEKAWHAGKIPFMKPISCHLYPIRVKKYASYQAVNYQEWSICSGGCQLGEKTDLRLYQFLKEPLIRRFGLDWYNEVCLAADLLKKEPSVKR